MIRKGLSVLTALALALPMLLTGVTAPSFRGEVRPAAAATPAFGETRITTNTANQYNPKIYGDKIVWYDAGSGSSDIYMHDITAGSETRITTDPAGQTSPAIYGDRIAFNDSRLGNDDIFMHDLITGNETPVVTNAARQFVTGFYGDKIVYDDNRAGNYDVYMYDLTDATETAIATGAADQYSGAIDGDKVVWQDFRSGNSDIYIYNLTTATETAIATGTAQQASAAIYGDKVVWQDDRNGADDIYIRNLTTGVETRITTDAETQASPSIYGDKIVWMDHRNGNYDIYMYNLTTGVETPIAVGPGDQTSPVIYGDKIVWQDTRNGDFDIYMYTLDTVAPTAMMTAPKFSTNVSKTKSFVVSWNGADAAPSSGIVSYDVQVKTNATGVWTSFKSAVAGKSAVFTGVPGNTYYFRARARDGAGNLGLWSAEKKTIVPFDQNSKITKRVGFDGTISKASSNYYLGTARFSTTAGDVITYSFTGNYFALIGTKGPKFSRAVVTIDGVKKTIDARAATKKLRQVLMEKALALKKHTVKIKNLGTAGRTRFELDGLGVGK